jgi:hypothetical protein
MRTLASIHPTTLESRTMKPLARPATLLLAAVPLASCSPALQRGPQVGLQTRQTTVVVENRSAEDLAVHLLLQGTRFRLGIAPSLRTTTLRLPQGVSGAVQLRADAVGSPRTTLQTGPMLVGSEDQIEWDIKFNPDLSSYLVRRVERP